MESRRPSVAKEDFTSNCSELALSSECPQCTRIKLSPEKIVPICPVAQKFEMYQLEIVKRGGRGLLGSAIFVTKESYYFIIILFYSHT